MDFYTRIILILAILNEAFAYYEETSEKQKTNVILFLAESDPNSQCEANEIPFLNIPLIGKVKPCISENNNNNNREMKKRCHRQSCNCNKRLESSITCLNNFARNTLGMATAIVSLTKEEIVDQTEEGFKYFNYRLETIDSATAKEEQNDRTNTAICIGGHNKNSGNEANHKCNRHSLFPNVNNGKLVLDKNGDTPILSMFPSKSFEFNNVGKHQKDRASKEDVEVIFKPGQRQAVAMSSEVRENPVQLRDASSPQKVSPRQSLWEQLGLMSAMRNSFFANFMTPMLDPQQRMADEESGMDYNSMGKQRDLPLFQLVKNTLARIQKQCKRSGFLLIVIGGNLTEITDCSSDLVQSIKHVSESTDGKRTLMIVSGNCPPNNKKHDCNNSNREGEEGRNDIPLPVFAKGPNAKMISKVCQLSDIPKQIKKVLRKDEENRNKRSGLNSNKNDLKYFDVMGEDDDKFKGVNVVKRDVSKDNRGNPIKALLNKFTIYVLFIFLIYLCMLVFLSRAYRSLTKKFACIHQHHPMV